MYGLILENLSEFVKATFGEEKWEEIRKLANVQQPSFAVHQVYPETTIPKLCKKAVQVLEISEEEFMAKMGVFFVDFVSQYGYDRVLSVLGRHMRDFLNGLDNLHEYLKFSYPRMKAPSFICENENSDGLTLHYRSKRRGFVYYTMGQIKQVGKHFYNTDVDIRVSNEEEQFDTMHVTFELKFDNSAFTQVTSLSLVRDDQHLPVKAAALFEIFPFCVVFGPEMIIANIGNSLMQIIPGLVGKKITEAFDMVRPLIQFQFKSILNRTNNIFELVTVEPVLRTRTKSAADDEDDPDDDRSLHLKGQMMYMDEWSMIMYLGTPVMKDLGTMLNTGLYINDLSMHDFSRDLMLAGTQQSVELKLALDQEQQKTKKLEESMKKLDDEMKRTDELLYQMIPKQVADRLRKGENPIDTCEVFENVTILFSDVVTFTEICSRISPMEVVSMLNSMYTMFDSLTEKNSVYKVETIGDAYMVVAGAPIIEENHSAKICDMAMDMVEAITDLKDPSTGEHLRIRVGVHTGTVVAGVVGLKMPRYCLFGDSVNTASRLESSSEAMKIHISEFTQKLLPENFAVVERGEVNLKGKGTMKTYWLQGREDRVSLAATNFFDQYKEAEASGRNAYSPVTMDDVARRSQTNSPVKKSAEEPEGEILCPPTPPTRKSTRMRSSISRGDSASSRKGDRLSVEDKPTPVRGGLDSNSSSPVATINIPVPTSAGGGNSINVTPDIVFTSTDGGGALDRTIPTEPNPATQVGEKMEQAEAETLSVAVNGPPPLVNVDLGPSMLTRGTAVRGGGPSLSNVVADSAAFCTQCGQALIQLDTGRIATGMRSMSVTDCCGGFVNKDKVQSNACVVL